MSTKLTDMKEVIENACRCLVYSEVHKLIPNIITRLENVIGTGFHGSLSVKITLQPNGTYQLSVTSKHGRHGIPSFSGTCDISLDEIFELANGLRAWRNEPLYEKPAEPVEPAPPAPPAPNPFINMSREGLNRIAEQSDKGDRDDIKALQDRGDSKSSQDGVDAPNPDAKLDADVNIAAKVSANSDVTFAYLNLQNAGQKADENTTSKIFDSGLDSKENQNKPDKR